MIQLSVVCAVYNEGQGVDELVDALAAVLPSVNEAHEVVIVDDYSTKNAGGVTMSIYAIVKDPDGHFARARAAGAEIVREPVTLQLRYLQTLTEIAVEKNSTILFPLPIDIMRAFVDRDGKKT